VVVVVQKSIPAELVPKILILFMVGVWGSEDIVAIVAGVAE
jgi:hypothetical protein